MDDAERLLDCLQQVIALLRRYHIDFWANCMQASHDRAATRDYYGLVGLLACFGGMGSFNDLYIHPYNGHPIQEGDVRPVNEQLRHLQDCILSSDMTIERKKETGYGRENGIQVMEHYTQTKAVGVDLQETPADWFAR